MRAALLLLAVVAASSALVLPQGRATLLHGALCMPCVNLITNGETSAEGDFDTWFDKETQKVCDETGFLKKECIAEFKIYEEEINHFITVKADPKTACQDIDFCNK